MSENRSLGAALALAGALLGIVGTFLLFTYWYEPLRAAELAAGRPDEEIIVKLIIPALSDIGIVGGLLWALSAYGFLTKSDWAWPVGMVANVLALQGSFFPMIPAASRDLPPAFGIVFVPNLVLYFGMLRGVRRVSWGRAILGLFTGMAFVLSFMNGVASSDRIMVIGTPLYVAVQRLNWLASIGWGIATVGILLGPREWTRVVALGAGLLEVVAGTPLGVATTVSFGHFSMFFPAPMLSLALLIPLAWPGMWSRITGAGQTSPAV